MYELSRAAPEDDGQAGGPKLTRSEVWAGLLIGACDARPVGPLITHCEVVEEEAQFQRLEDSCLHTVAATLAHPRELKYSGQPAISV
ncbi:AtaL-like protein [Streptomyces sp. Inha503]|uniref:AtaL-like protein n=1 Tax=Streptomyces sp. Inha503 TaxID=3383314 RepID=UPI00399F47F0